MSNREAGFKGAEASQQDAVAEAGDRDQGSAGVDMCNLRTLDELEDRRFRDYLHRLQTAFLKILLKPPRNNVSEAMMCVMRVMRRWL